MIRKYYFIILMFLKVYLSPVGNIVPIIGGGFEGEVPNGLVLCGGMRPGPPPVLSPPK